jgi:alpha-glucosidase
VKAQLKVNVKGAYKDGNALGNVTILGVSGAVSDVKLNGVTIDKGKVMYDQQTSVLKLAGLNDLTCGGAWMGSWTLSWT